MVFFILLLTLIFGQLDGSVTLMSWNVNKVERTALVYMPEKYTSQKSPLVFVWHGHRGSSEKFIERCPIHKFWPEAIVVYPQGLNTITPYDKKGVYTGWQYSIGDYTDRDIVFFDEMYNHFTDHNLIDTTRVHCLGSSNGGSFTYILIQERPNIFASVVPAIASHIGSENHCNVSFTGIPILHITGKKERTFYKQKQLVEKIIEYRDSKRAGKWKGLTGAQYYPSRKGDLIWWVHDQGHSWRYADTRSSVKFFKAYPKK